MLQNDCIQNHANPDSELWGSTSTSQLHCWPWASKARSNLLFQCWNPVRCFNSSSCFCSWLHRPFCQWTCCYLNSAFLLAFSSSSPHWMNPPFCQLDSAFRLHYSPVNHYYVINNTSYMYLSICEHQGKDERITHNLQNFYLHLPSKICHVATCLQILWSPDAQRWQAIHFAQPRPQRLLGTKKTVWMSGLKMAKSTLTWLKY